MRPHGCLRDRLALAVSGLLLCLLSPLPGLAADPELKVTPDLVEIGAFFRGHRIAVEAKIPPGAEAVLEVVGSTADEHLMRKGRRGGLWMNVGEIDVHNAPSLYMIMSSSPKLLESAAPETPWGFGTLQRRVSLSGMVSDQEKGEFFEQFLKLKKDKGLYDSLKNPAKKGKASGDLTTVQGEFRLPTNVKPGTYQVCLSVVKDGQLLAKNCDEVQVKLVGFTAMISTLAYEHGATYGILAVVIAIVTGFAMGFLFKGGGGH